MSHSSPSALGYHESITCSFFLLCTAHPAMVRLKNFVIRSTKNIHMEPFLGHWLPARVEVVGQRQTLSKGGGRKATGLRALIYHSGVAECSMKTILMCTSLAGLAESASSSARLFNVSSTVHALQCCHRGKVAACDKKKGQQADIGRKTPVCHGVRRTRAEAAAVRRSPH